jgi:glycosyltransferase involved in cell wall biosynthesis
MKILMLADANSPHTIKWVTSLTKKGLTIHLISLGNLEVNSYNNIKNVNITTVSVTTSKKIGSFKKIKYMKALPLIKKVIKEFQPNILHAHYASSYGLLGALSNFYPFIVSVWGRDVYNFPKKSFLHKKILQFILNKANIILSTSYTMAQETSKYTSKPIEVIPFGVDINIFKPKKVKSLFNEKDIVIGTIKSLEDKYGIEYLIKAFKLLTNKYPYLPLKLLIVGGGSLEKKLKKLVIDLKIQDKTFFTGKVPYEEIPKYHNMLSIEVFPSIEDSESFGVAVVEAMACAKPVIVTKVGGLPEVVENGKTGFIVPPKNPIAIAEALKKLIFNKALRYKMGLAGRERVLKFYNLEDNLNKMIQIYKKLRTI